MSSRVDSLAEVLHIAPWFKGDVNEDISDVFYCDYISVEKHLKKEREYAIKFLSDNLVID